MSGSSVKSVNFILAPLGSTAEKSEDALDTSKSDSTPIATNIFEAQDTGFDPYAQSHKRWSAHLESLKKEMVTLQTGYTCSKEITDISNALITKNYQKRQRRSHQIGSTSGMEWWLPEF